MTLLTVMGSSSYLVDSAVTEVTTAQSVAAYVYFFFLKIGINVDITVKLTYFDINK